MAGDETVLQVGSREVKAPGTSAVMPFNLRAAPDAPYRERMRNKLCAFEEMVSRKLVSRKIGSVRFQETDQVLDLPNALRIESGTSRACDGCIIRDVSLHAIMERAVIPGFLSTLQTFGPDVCAQTMPLVSPRHCETGHEQKVLRCPGYFGPAWHTDNERGEFIFRVECRRNHRQLAGIMPIPIERFR